MPVTKPTIPSGTRDFSPGEMLGRNYIFSTVKEVFELFGFLPLETPALENLSTLLGKYGEEGDKLLFRVLNSGDFLAKADEISLKERDSQKLSAFICERGLRYDLTVPFARYVVQHRNDITFPFRRYQIQPVWRADRPQKGRYREFYQCDADTIGSNSLLNEAELVKMADMVFTRLKIPVIIKLNNRKILSGIAETIGEASRITDITVALDKIEKTGKDSVIQDLRNRGISEVALDKLMPLFGVSGSREDKIHFLEIFLSGSESGIRGIEEMKKVFHLLSGMEIKHSVELDLTLARGLNYYTGAIIEVKAAGQEIGSLCGGGRYDDLTGIFGMPDVSGVGISFGADRIFDVMQKMEIFPEGSGNTTRVMFVNFGEKETQAILPLISNLRERGIATELYPEAAKFQKQLGFANTRGIPFVALAGEKELQEGKITLKNMKTGTQSEYDAGKLGDALCETAKDLEPD